MGLISGKRCRLKKGLMKLCLADQLMESQDFLILSSENDNCIKFKSKRHQEKTGKLTKFPSPKSMYKTCGNYICYIVTYGRTCLKTCCWEAERKYIFFSSSSNSYRGKCEGYISRHKRSKKLSEFWPTGISYWWAISRLKKSQNISEYWST